MWTCNDRIYLEIEEHIVFVWLGTDLYQPHRQLWLIFANSISVRLPIEAVIRALGHALYQSSGKSLKDFQVPDEAVMEASLQIDGLYVSIDHFWNSFSKSNSNWLGW